VAQSRIITLTTDFGLNDYYVGAMRGVILGVNPEAAIHDICNTVQSFDLLDGAMTIAQSYRYYPSDTVHMVIVDPGVGSARPPILVTTERHYFLAPDNGVLSLVYEQEERVTVRRIEAEHYFLQPVSKTFHGRDVFAPIAGWLSKGVDPSKFGDVVDQYVRFSLPKPKIVSPHAIKGIVLRVDKFGNLITNIRMQELAALQSEPTPAFRLQVGKTELARFRSIYAEASMGELFALEGSSGYLEIAANRASAAQLAQAAKGSEVQITFAEPQFNAPSAT